MTGFPDYSQALEEVICPSKGGHLPLKSRLSKSNLQIYKNGTSLYSAAANGMAHLPQNQRTQKEEHRDHYNKPGLIQPEHNL
jgi:hypothetical protein